MNRRDFLKTLGLALSALVLPKVKVEPSVAVAEPPVAESWKPSGQDAVVEMFDGTDWVTISHEPIKVHKLSDCVSVTDEWLADVISLFDCISCDDRRLWQMFNETAEQCRLYGLEPV